MGEFKTNEILGGLLMSVIGVLHLVENQRVHIFAAVAGIITLIHRKCFLGTLSASQMERDVGSNFKLVLGVRVSIGCSNGSWFRM